MIWLASFPRSGNTFFRNVLYEVYGIESSEYHILPDKSRLKNYEDYPVIKTHLLPHQLPEHLHQLKSVYLVRDGRDALVSIAHHRKDIVAPGSNYYFNLLEAILARGGSFFGGWSGNVKAWTSRADIIIRFEDLIQDPIKEVEKLRAIMDLPPPNLNKIPDFESLKKGRPMYGGGGEKAKKDRALQLKLNDKFYRRGKIGSYKDEMPWPFKALFWMKNQKEMSKLGYYK